MHKNKIHTSNNFDFDTNNEKSIYTNQNQSFDNNQFLAVGDKYNQARKLPSINNNYGVSRSKNKVNEAETGNKQLDKKIGTIDINVEYKGNKNIKLDYNNTNKKKEEMSKGSLLKNSENNERETRLTDPTKRTNQDNKMFLYSSINQSSLKPTSIAEASRSINISKLNTSSPQVNSKHRSLFKNTVVIRKENQPSIKYTSQIEKVVFLTEDDLGTLSVEDIEKWNDKIRIVIRKLNGELNEIIDRITVFKRSESKPDVEKSYRLLEQNFKNNQKIIQTKQIELKKLKEKVNGIKQQDYEIGVLNQIAEQKEKKKVLQKEITDIKSNCTKAAKISTQAKFKNKDIIKNDLLHLKKQVERHETKKKQTFFKYCEVEEKSDKLNKKYEELIEQMNEKGLEVKSTDALTMKKKQLEEKEKQLKKGIQNINSLYKSKGDILNNDNVLIKRNISNYQMQIKNMYSQIVEIANRSSLLIQKQKIKQNPKLFKNVLNSLEVISKSVSNTPLNFQLSRLGMDSNLSSDDHYDDKNKSRVKTESECQEVDSPSKLIIKNEGSGKNSNKLNKNVTVSERRERQDDQREHEKMKTFEIDKKSDDKKQREDVGKLKPAFNVKKKQESLHSAKKQVQKEEELESVVVKSKPFNKMRKQSRSSVQQSNVDQQNEDVKSKDKDQKSQHVDQDEVEQKEKNQFKLKTKDIKQDKKQQQLPKRIVNRTNKQHQEEQYLQDFDQPSAQPSPNRNQFQSFLLTQNVKQKSKISQSEQTDLF